MGKMISSEISAACYLKFLRIYPPLAGTAGSPLHVIPHLIARKELVQFLGVCLQNPTDHFVFSTFFVSVKGTLTFGFPPSHLGIAQTSEKSSRQSAFLNANVLLHGPNRHSHTRQRRHGLDTTS